MRCNLALNKVVKEETNMTFITIFYPAIKEEMRKRYLRKTSDPFVVGTISNLLILSFQVAVSDEGST